MVRFETSHGVFTVELFEQEAPLTVANFLQYVDDGFFDGTIVHRIVPGFVIQGGGLTADFVQKKTRAPVKNEATNGERNERGTLSMARNGPDTATSDFSICIGDQPSLNFGGKRNPDGQGFAAFGRVTRGMDVVRKIQAAPADGQRLTPPITIVRIRRVRN